VVVVVGLTAVVPIKSTLPIPLSMVTLVASVTLQVKLEICPGITMTHREAKKELMTGVITVTSTVTVTEAVMLPVLLVAVRV